MCTTNPLYIICGVSLILLVGCSSNKPEPEKYSGYLNNYSDLQETKTISGKTVLRWIDPEFKENNYDSLVFNQVVYFPEPKPTSQLGKKVLDDILNYTNDKLITAAARRKPLVTIPGNHSLIFRGAITAVDSSKMGMQFYEVLPVAMLVAGTQVMTGHRTMETNLYFEGELVDATTHKPVIKFVRKAEGETVSNENTPINLATLKPAINDIANDAIKYTAN